MVVILGTSLADFLELQHLIPPILLFITGANPNRVDGGGNEETIVAVTLVMRRMLDTIGTERP